MKNKDKKWHLKLDPRRILENAIASIITGIVVALFSFWLTKAYGFDILGG